MKKLIIILCCLCSVSLFAQKSKADRKFKLYEYSEAIPLYRQHLDKNPGDYDATKNLALAYKYTNNINGSILTYRTLVNLREAIAEDWYDLVQLLRISGNLNDAGKFAAIYKQKNDGEKAQNLLKSIEMYHELMAGTNYYTVVNKTSHLDQSVFASHFHQGLIVTAEEVKGSKSAWTGRGYTKLYQTDNNFTRLVPFATELMSDLNDGIATFSVDGNTMYYTTVNKKSILEQDVNTSKLQISKATFSEGKWRLAEPFEYNNVGYNVAHPALRNDGNMLVFSSDKPGGKGGMDLYYCVKQSISTWSEPINITILNTSENEIFPGWDANNKMYFASNGLPGLGGLDVFMTQYEGNNFGTPVNLKSPINSNYDDFSLSTNNNLESGYVSTNRFGTPETDDIAFFSRALKESIQEVVTQAEQTIVQITVLDKYTSIPLPYVSVSIKDNQNNLIYKGMTDPNGQVMVEELPADIYKVQGLLNDITTTMAIISKDEFSSPLIEKTINHNDPRFTLSGITINTMDGPPVAGVEVICENTTMNRTNSVITGEDGKFFFQLEQSSDFKVLGEKKGWLSSEVLYETTKGLDRSKDLYVKIKLSMQQPTAKDIIRLDKIYYDYDKCDIKPRAGEELRRLVNLMNDYPDMIIELSSHTDSRGSNAYNATLSQCRADAAVEYIVGKGISTSRIVPKGYGESKLVNECADGVNCSEPKHQENRRTEFSILECPSCPKVLK